MTSVSKSSLLPEIVARLGRLEIRARHVVEGLLTGLHRSPYFGQSVEFLQHRQYVPGDDVRSVDWKAWARRDRLYVKQYEEDTNLRCALLVDASASMSYGHGPMTKFDYAATAAAAIALLLLRQQDAVGCVTFDESVRQRIPLRTSQNHLYTILGALDSDAPRDKTGLANVLRSAAESFPRRGMMVLISDLFADPEETLTGLRFLRQQGHDVLVFHLLDDDELDFPFTGPSRFEGLESDELLNCNPRALREGYLDALEDFLGTLRRGCATAGIEYTVVRTSAPFDAALLGLMRRRLGRATRQATV